jgi:hypothetical protein
MTKARDLANGGFGLVLVKPSSVVNGTDNGKGTVNFTGVSAVSLNGVFSTTYDNYRILVTDNYSSASGPAVTLRLRKSGSDNSTASSYRRGGFYSDTSALGNSFSGGAADYYITSLNNTSTVNTWSQIEIYSPFVNTQSGISNITFRPDSESVNAAFGRHAVTDTFDGLTLTVASGTMTGKISVYGYNK